MDDLPANLVPKDDLPAPKAVAPARTSGVPQATAPLKPGIAFNDPNRKPAVNTSALDASIGGQNQAAGNAITGTLGLLQRVPNAWDALLTGGNVGGALAGDDQTGTQAKVDAAINRFPGGTNPVMHGVYHAGMNPLNLIDLPLGAAAKGRSLGQLATDAVEGHGFNAAVKAGGAIAKLGPGGQAVTNAVSKVHDLMGVQSAAKRALAQLHGPQWLDQYAKYRAQFMQMGEDPTAVLKPAIQNQLDTLQGPDRAAFVDALARADQGLPFASPLNRKPGTMTVQQPPVAPPPIVKPTVAPPKPVPAAQVPQAQAPTLDALLHRPPYQRPNVPGRPVPYDEEGYIGGNVPQGPAIFNGDHNSPSFIAGARGSRPVNWPLQLGVKPNITAKQMAQMQAAKQTAPVALDSLAPGAGAQMDLLAPLIKQKYGQDTADILSQVAGYKPPTGSYSHVQNPEQLDFMGNPMSQVEDAVSPEQQMLKTSEPSLFEGSREPINYGGRGPQPTLGYSKSAIDQMVENVAKKWSANTPEDQKIFDLMKPSRSFTVGPKPIWDSLSAPSDLMTAGLFAIPFGHMANISTLGALTDPTAVAGALARGTVNNARGLGGAINNATGGKLGFLGTGGEDAAALAARHAPAQAGGAISSHAFEQTNRLTEGLDAGSNALDALASGIKGKLPGAGGAIAAAPVQALSLIPKALSGLYKASGNVLWKFDDEVKAQRWQNLVDGGMDPQRAGLRVGGELVDYENKSPIAGAIRPIAPFATWRTKAPLAVGRNIIENPGKASAIQNQLPAVFGGDQGEDPESGKPYTSSLPPAELNTLLSDPAKYAQATVGAGPRLAGDLAGMLFSANKRTGSAQGDDAAKRKFRTLFTYGKEPLEYALNHIPGWEQYLQYSGNGMFGTGAPPSLQNDALSNLLVRPH